MTRAALTDLVNHVKQLFPECASLPLPIIEQKILETGEYNSFQLEGLPEISTSAVVETKRFIDPVGGAWDKEARVQDLTWALATPSGSDLIHGEWTFASHQQGINISGMRYDLYRACASLARHLGSVNGAGGLSFSADGLSINLGNVIMNYNTMAASFDALSRPQTIKLNNA